MKSSKKRLDKLLLEKGTISKSWSGRISAALVYPNVYHIGMSNLGFQTIYMRLNELEHVVCERVFIPDEIDPKKILSLESGRALQDFDIIAFSISFEEDYLNILKILDLARIPFYSSDRGEGYPLVIAGGAITFLNPEPIADFLDLFVIGEGEDVVAELFDVLRSFRKSQREELFKALAAIHGIYIPSFYSIAYHGDGTIKEFKPLYNVPAKIKKRRVENIDKYPVSSVIITKDTGFKNTELIEVSRGCGRQCRFCAAGFIYLPPRERGIEVIRDAVLNGIKRTGKVGLVGAQVSEYKGINEILKLVVDMKGEATLSSIRTGVMDRETIILLRKAGYKTMTLAPEAGSERLRDVINKCIRDEEIITAIKNIYEAGFLRLKLYFITGFPLEEDDDIYKIISLVKAIRSIMKKGEITLKINPFIPKPLTPFQWVRYSDVHTLKERFKIIKDGLVKIKGIKINLLSPREGYIQTYLAMADRRACGTLAKAYEKGWKEALRYAEPDPDFFVYRDKRFEEILPWDFIDHGIKKSYLWSEYQRALKEITTPPCDTERCRRCGVC